MPLAPNTLRKINNLSGMCIHNLLLCNKLRQNLVV